jgi:ABC-type dipeptide/oligopeptide/nickel transport system ATPase component
MPLLEIRDLSVEYKRGTRIIPAVRNVSFAIEPGETLGLVGESGSGKSTIALAILRLLPMEARITSGKIIFEGTDLLTSDQEDLQKIRGEKIGIVFQDPFSSLNPVLTIGHQIIETLSWHHLSDPGGRARELLAHVQLPDAERILASYPHQISGGQRQRVMIALAIGANPKLLIADEPTTALDVTVQKEILDLLARLEAELAMSVLLVTHNLAVVSEQTQRCAVMREGLIVELRPTAELLSHPRHPYTRELIACVPAFPPCLP